MSNISDLKFDSKNFNKHTEYGMSLLEKSLRENGAGRSILIDKDNNIIAGNGIGQKLGLLKGGSSSGIVIIRRRSRQW